MASPHSAMEYCRARSGGRKGGGGWGARGGVVWWEDSTACTGNFGSTMHACTHMELAAALHHRGFFGAPKHKAL